MKQAATLWAALQRGTYGKNWGQIPADNQRGNAVLSLTISKEPNPTNNHMILEVAPSPVDISDEI